jgi:hypothetical protein
MQLIVKSLINVVVFLLLGVTVLQWSLITYLLQGRHEESTPVQSIPDCPPFKRSKELSRQHDEARERLSSTTTTANSADFPTEGQQQERQYPGVAATIFFSAPMWFSRRIPILIHNVLSNIPPDWAVQLIVRQSFWNDQVLPYHPGLPRLIENHAHRIIVTPLPETLESLKQPNQNIPLTTWFWETRVAERVLMFSGNGILCTHGNTADNWKALQRLDYCGTPWGHFHKEGGDSATHSYRNRTVMLEAMQYAHQHKLVMNPPEGMAFVGIIKKMNQDSQRHQSYRLATRQDTRMFGGVQTTNSTVKGHKRSIPPPPMVVSGTQAQLNFQEREDLLMVCPELKVIFPSLHEPSCFGAHPDPVKCKATICALQDELPGSGC